MLGFWIAAYLFIFQRDTEQLSRLLFGQLIELSAGLVVKELRYTKIVGGIRPVHGVSQRGLLGSTGQEALDLVNA